MPTLEFVSPRMLIVDDVDDNRAVLSKLFSKRGYDIVEAANGAAALRLIDAQSFDIVLLDIIMTGISGIDVLKVIRKTFSADRLPVIMVTARTGVADVVEALEQGANDYLTKPVELAVAFARVTSQLERKRAQESLERSVARLTSKMRQLETEILELRRADACLDHFARGHGSVSRLERGIGTNTL